MAKNSYIRDLLTNTARVYGVNLVRLSNEFEKYAHAMRHVGEGRYASIEELNAAALDNALSTATNHENLVFGDRYARAYLAGDEDAVRTMRDDMNRLPQIRWQGIQDATKLQIPSLCFSVCLPELQVAFGKNNDIAHPTLSAADKNIFSDVFHARIPIADDFSRRKGVALTNEDIEQVELIEQNLELAKQRWDKENWGLNFGSLTNRDERRDYDQDRGKPDYGRPSGRGGGRISRAWRP